VGQTLNIKGVRDGETEVHWCKGRIIKKMSSALLIGRFSVEQS